jgi:hypothetical protein
MTDDDSAAARRVSELLATLRADPSRSTALTERVVHRARWQRAIVRPLRAVGFFGSAVADGLRTLLGISQGAR